MKNLLKLTLVLFLFTVVISSCKKDDPDPEVVYNLDTDYFGVENAPYIKAAFPEASSSAPTITTINGNPSVIPGGSNPIGLQADGSVSNVLIGVKEVGGYYKLPNTAKGTEDIVYFFILMNQNLTDTNFEIMIAIQDDNGNVSEVSIIPVSLVQVGTGRLQVSCSWDQLNDVDLHLVEPNGEEIYYGNGSSSNGGDLDLDSNAACSNDGVNNENITYNDEAIIEDGEYIVRVDFWSNCNITSATNYNVTAYYEGELVAATFGTNPYSGSFNPDEADAGGVGSGVEVLKFELPTGAKSSNTEAVLKFNYPSDKKMIKVLSPQKM